MTEAGWNAKMRAALARTDIMALSTIGSDGSWTSPVQYSCDEKLHFYFMSKPDAKHVRNILRNPRVSLAIYRTDRPITPPGRSIGLQVKGVARRIAREGEWHRFEITPKEVWYFDSRVSLQRARVDLAALGG
jgi:uncharacterized protein YhbP (UPF0306 family)